MHNLRALLRGQRRQLRQLRGQGALQGRPRSTPASQEGSLSGDEAVHDVAEPAGLTRALHPAIFIHKAGGLGADGGCHGTSGTHRHLEHRLTEAVLKNLNLSPKAEANEQGEGGGGGQRTTPGGTPTALAQSSSCLSVATGVRGEELHTHSSVHCALCRSSCVAKQLTYRYATHPADEGPPAPNPYHTIVQIVLQHSQIGRHAHTLWRGGRSTDATAGGGDLPGWRTAGLFLAAAPGDGRGLAWPWDAAASTNAATLDLSRPRNPEAPDMADGASSTSRPRQRVTKLKTPNRNYSGTIL
jgi:hypothetical protein